MLTEISPEKFDEWYAWWLLDGNILQRIERMLAIGFANLNNGLSRAFGGPLLDMEHFLLRTTFGRSAAPPEKKPMSPEAAAAAFQLHYGPPPGEQHGHARRPCSQRRR